LVVVDEPTSASQTIHLWKQIGVLEVRPTVENDHRLARADLTALSSKPFTAM